MRGHRREFDWLDVLFVVAILFLFVGGLWARRDAQTQSIERNAQTIEVLCKAIPSAAVEALIEAGLPRDQAVAFGKRFAAQLAAQLDTDSPCLDELEAVATSTIAPTSVAGFP